MLYHKQQLRQGESNVQYSQAADREIEVIPKNVSPVCNCCPLDNKWFMIKRKQQQLTAKICISEYDFFFRPVVILFIKGDC